MSTKININVEGIDNVNNALKGIRNELKDFSIPLIKSGDYYIQEISQNFDERGGRFGEVWSPLSDRRLKEKFNLYTEGKAIAIAKPLICTGWLQNSFNWLLRNKASMDIKSDAPYAELMHSGGMNSEGKMVPARTITKVDDARETKVNNIFAEWLRNKINQYIYQK